MGKSRLRDLCRGKCKDPEPFPHPTPWARLTFPRIPSRVCAEPARSLCAHPWGRQDDGHECARAGLAGPLGRLFSRSV